MTTVILDSIFSFVLVLFVLGFIKEKIHAARLFKLIQSLKSDLEIINKNKRELMDENHHLKQEVMMLRADPVTGLMSWKVFLEQFEQNRKESETYHFIMSFIFLDLDNFRSINTTFNHVIGDALLREVGKRLQESTRSVDSVSRYSKDTFGIVLCQLGKPDAAAVVAQRILQALAQPFQIHGNEIYITASLGIALYASGAEQVSELITNADYALHLAKQSGKHSYHFYDAELHKYTRRAFALYTRLHHESVFSEMQLCYQPIVDANSEAVICMDTVLRWQHPEFGMIPHHEFSQLLDQQRKSTLFSEWMIKTACKQLLTWETMGAAPQMVSIQLSTKQLENSQFIYNVSTILRSLDFQPQRLLLHIKECSEAVSHDIIEKAVNMFNYIGVKLAVDQFGSGQFPLGCLKRLNVHYLRIESALIEDISANANTRHLLGALVGMANNLGITLIAPGVSAKEELELLRQAGCQLLQGSLWGEPLMHTEMDVSYFTR